MIRYPGESLIMPAHTFLEPTVVIFIRLLATQDIKSMQVMKSS